MGGGDSEEATRPEEVAALDDVLNRITDDEGDLVVLITIELMLVSMIGIVLDCAVELKI